MDDAPPRHKLETTEHIQTFVIHFFRAETSREATLLRRLDVTINGAVVVTGGIVSFGFSSPDVSHVILLANVLALLGFLFVEARRYQMYAKQRYRVRQIEEDYIAPLFNQITQDTLNIDYDPFIDHGVVTSILNHKPPISRLEALALRLQRVYIYFLSVTFAVWLAKLFVGYAGQPWWEFINQQARLGNVSGSAVFIAFATFMLVAWAVSVYVSVVSDESDL
ncbi:MAG: DUF2270 domain-containing protein [Chloroflexi bacterium]|nr:DUF2270 domain-containing protein [Chloroflexota bacterium]